jgi:hypothetical protein
MDLQAIWTGLLWLRTGIVGGLLSMWYGTFEFLKISGIA